MWRNKPYGNVTLTTFDTPLVRLRRIIPRQQATVFLKLEYVSPCASIKDRIGRAMIEAAEHACRINRQTQIIEATSGNTGIALAFVAATKGYQLTLVMPESMTVERRSVLRALGARLELTPDREGMRGALARARELAELTPHSWMPQQFENPSNPGIHEATTGPEIWTDTQGQVDFFVAGVGTGGTITGVGRYLRPRKPGLQVVAVEPAESAVISGKTAGQHRIQGIGSGFIPKNLDLDVLSGVETVTFEEACAWARRLACEEGILAGMSTGANLAVVARLAARPENRGATFVTIAASSGERYLSTPLFQIPRPTTAPLASRVKLAAV